MSKAEGLKMIEVAIDLLNHLVENNQGMGTREISRKFDISSSSAQRLVTSLEKKHILTFDNYSQKYILGYGLFRLIQNSISKYDLLKIAQPYMLQLRDFTKETVCLNTIIENKRVTILQEESNQELRWVTKIGKAYPIYIGASGKVILAHLNEELMTEILDVELNELSIEEKEKVKESLMYIKETGFAVTFGERIQGGVGIAVPININHQIFSISIYAPSSRIDQRIINLYVEKLKEVANAIENIYEKKVIIQ